MSDKEIEVGQTWANESGNRTRTVLKIKGDIVYYRSDTGYCWFCTISVFTNFAHHQIPIGIKEREELSKYPNESLIKEILPVIDSLQKAISHVQDDKNPSGLVEGLELTLGGLITTLEKAGLKEVEAEGKPFDPTFHEAISQQRDDKVAPGLVVTEFQKGYLLNGRLIRPAMVVVSQGDTNKKEDTV